MMLFDVDLYKIILCSICKDCNIYCRVIATIRYISRSTQSYKQDRHIKMSELVSLLFLTVFYFSQHCLIVYSELVI